MAYEDQVTNHPATMRPDDVCQSPSRCRAPWRCDPSGFCEPWCSGPGWARSFLPPGRKKNLLIKLPCYLPPIVI